MHEIVPRGIHPRSELHCEERRRVRRIFILIFARVPLMAVEGAQNLPRRGGPQLRIYTLNRMPPTSSVLPSRAASRRAPPARSLSTAGGRTRLARSTCGVASTAFTNPGLCGCAVPQTRKWKTKHAPPGTLVIDGRGDRLAVLTSQVPATPRLNGPLAFYAVVRRQRAQGGR